MTLIAIAYDLKTKGFAALTDVMISEKVDPRSYKEGNTEIIPNQVGLGPKTTTHAESIELSTHATRIQSKAVTFGNYLILWAAESVLTAREAINELKNVPHLTPEVFSEIALKHDPDVKQLNLVMCFFDGSQSWYAFHGGKRSEIGTFVLHAGGSGDEDFLDLDLGFWPTSNGYSELDIISNRLISLLQYELTSNATHKAQLYGGAYEMFTKRMGGGFRRIPYSILEISDRDHITGEAFDFFMDSRSIQCVPSSRGAMFSTAVSSYAGKEGQRLSLHAANELTNRSNGQPVLFDLNQELEGGFCYVISDKSSWHVSPTPFVKFIYNNYLGVARRQVDQVAVQEMVDLYRRNFEGA